MHFQPLEEIAENLEERNRQGGLGGRNPNNLPLINRLLSAAPSPSALMGGGALMMRRASAQLQQRLTRSVSPDPSYSDDDDEQEMGGGVRGEVGGDRCGVGGSLGSVLGHQQETRSSTLCGCSGGAVSSPNVSMATATTTVVRFDGTADGRGGGGGGGRKKEGGEEEEEEERKKEGKREETETGAFGREVVTETRASPPATAPLPLLLPPPVRQSLSRGHPGNNNNNAPAAASAFKTPRLLSSTSANSNRSTPDFLSFQPISDRAKVLTPVAKPISCNKATGMSLLTVPSFDTPAASLGDVTTATTQQSWASVAGQEPRSRSVSMGSSDVGASPSKTIG